MASPSLKAPKGTRDLFGAEGEAFTRLEKVARAVFDLYQFKEIRIPAFESVDLFSRSLGATSDVVAKEMFTFQDRGRRNFALRPEGTAGVVRHYIEKNLGVQGRVHRLYYMGPMFRGERPQAGRYRQFWQIGSEYFGDPSPVADAETVLMAGRILQEFGVDDFSVEVNSLGSPEDRQRYRRALRAYLKSKETSLTPESRSRLEENPLRVLDSKIDGPKLTDAPLMRDFLSPESRDHYGVFLSLIRQENGRVVENPRLVRGLDYYTHSVFEIVSPELGAQNALAAGGRYDGLVEYLGGPKIPGVGFALGMDRLVSLVSSLPAERAAPFHDRLVVVIPLSDGALKVAFSLSQELRAGGFSVPPLWAGKKIKNQLSQAVDLKARWAILIGEDELKQGKFTLKDLSSREQTSMARSNLIPRLFANIEPAATPSVGG